MRDAYNRPLDRQGEEALEENPSYFAEIYIMKADGSGQKRLTNVAGLRRRPVLHAGRHADRLAALRRIGPHRRRLDDEARRQRPAADHRLRLDELGALHAPVRASTSSSRRTSSGSRTSSSSSSTPRARRSRCASPTPTASTACRCPRPTARSWRGRRAAPAAPAGQMFLAQWNHEKALEALRKRAARREKSRMKS